MSGIEGKFLYNFREDLPRPGHLTEYARRPLDILYRPEYPSSTLTVSGAWRIYEPITKRDNRAWDSDCGRAVHICRLLGRVPVTKLTIRDVDDYRNARLTKTTKRGDPPARSTLNREVELLRRMINYLVRCGEIERNPLKSLKLLKDEGRRDVIISEAEFQSVWGKADKHLRPIILLAFDTGMRKEECLGLKWNQVDLDSATIRLKPENTKNAEPRTVMLTGRVVEALRELEDDEAAYVFNNPRTKTRWKEIRKKWDRACVKAGLSHLWFHDLRRSFVTNARRRGIPESLIMKMSGHKTRSIFDRHYNIILEDDLRKAVKKFEKGVRSETKNLASQNALGVQQKINS